MTIENIASGVKLAIFIARVLKNPEEEAIKIIEEFSDTSNTEISELKSSICKKIECNNINIAPGEDCIIVEFIGIKHPINEFVVNIVGYGYTLIEKMKIFITPFLPGIDIDNNLKQLSVTNNEINNTVTIEFPGREDMILLEANYDPEREAAIINIPIDSEKLLLKLREMQEHE